MSNIIFIGDSFCSSFNQGQNRPRTISNPHPDFHPNIVATNYNANLYCFGYGAKSWWYSYQKFNNAIKQDPSILKNAIAIIFFHSLCDRINSSDDCISTTLTPPHYGKFNAVSPLDAEYAEAYQSWLKYIYDEEHQQWSQQQYFKELKELYNGIKTIHFHCFKKSISYSNLLPGMVYTNPSLYNISLDQDIDKNFGITAFNHLTNYNNVALANLIIQSIDNYVPGQHEIDLTKFQRYYNEDISYTN